MEERKWEDLDMDCLVNILGRVGMESLLLNVPFVCKSWYKATLDPSCWRCLKFPRIDHIFVERLKEKYKIELYATQHSWITYIVVGGQSSKSSEVGLMGGETKSVSITAFIKSIVNRSSKTATVVILPSSTTEEALKYIANECPSLEILSLPFVLSDAQKSIIPELFGKWKNLKGWLLQSCCNLKEILSQINLNCKNFEALNLTDTSMTEEEASDIVTLLPNIKMLALKSARFNRKGLVMILQGCKELKYLDVSVCFYFEEDDEILKLASHIRTFKYKIVRAYDYDDDYQLSSWDADGYSDGYSP